MDAQQVREINARVNRAIRYQSDDEDRWQSPEETRQRGAGDCEDYAILKLAEMLAEGCDPEDARMVYCRRQIGRGEDAHMVLEVKVAGEFHVLDNLGSLISRWDERPDLQPLFSFNASTMWIRGKPTEHDPRQRLGQWQKVLDRDKRQGSYLGD